MPTQSPRPLAKPSELPVYRGQSSVSRPLQVLRVALGTLNVSDRDLLASFVASRDEEAFTEIVRRHGPMVLGVCRRVTARQHDAEDAFQATFLVLARRAAHVSQPELLANWLYGVAYRTALDARAARRRAEEHIVAAAPEPPAPSPREDVAELRRAIDEELAKLPEKYGTAIVLCDLEGLSRADAAARMSIPKGTLSSRLAYARKLLADRLTRRGITASAAAMAAVLGQEAIATIPHNLMHTTVLAAMRFAPGGAVQPEVSPAVSSLTEGVLKTMLVTRLRQLFAVGLLTCGLIGVGAALAQQFDTAPPPAQSPYGNASQNTRDVANDPDAQRPEGPKKPAPLKSVAKGIEDEDVPYPSPPKQAIVRIEDGKLIVRQRSYYFASVPVVVNDGSVMMTQQKRSGVNVIAIDASEVAAFDMKGSRVPTKEWKETLKNDRHVLISADGSLPNPRELALFKADTLLLVVPQQPDAPPAGGFHVGGFSYAPLPAGTSPAVAPKANRPVPLGIPSQPAPSITPRPRPNTAPPPLITPSLLRDTAPAPAPQAIPNQPVPMTPDPLPDTAPSSVPQVIPNQPVPTTPNPLPDNPPSPPQAIPGQPMPPLVPPVALPDSTPPLVPPGALPPPPPGQIPLQLPQQQLPLPTSPQNIRGAVLKDIDVKNNAVESARLW